MIDYPAAQAVAMVVQTGSFERAARALNVTPSAVSQRVKQLEERLGVVLIERGTPCTATEKGAWLCRHIEHVGVLERELMQQMPGLRGPAERRVTISVAANADSVGTWFLKAIAPFTRSSAHLMNIEIDDEGHTAEWLERGRVLAAVTSFGEPVRGCRVTPLGALRYQATASPDFVRRHFAEGVMATTLGAAPALTFNHKDRLQQRWVLEVTGEAAAFPTHWLPSTQGFVDACVAGIGWALNPASLVADHLAAGRLVEVVPGATLDVPLYWQVSRFAADRLPELTRSVVAAGRRELAQ
ncbi:MAG TPA: LysR family transcriptional regulator ArgP [Devosia sp.]|jgi:LysR family transcriptional regulator (chromosome initiation inhibitor)|uniref:LysR family transcriptional regulator ArgP n=1 Tax=Devosia sp. TaxID=1871048 RepID=UPI002DDD56B3|nr:LysR family transcriptional regulator ArgP [Devosia sp.]HEV2517812.1 LysR family transcriptional regulator ArgP [Devosia sp.]